jgi:hypothetical protein
MAGPISSTSGIAAGLQSIQNRTPQSTNRDSVNERGQNSRSQIDDTSDINDTSSISTELDISQLNVIDLNVDDTLSTAGAGELAEQVGQALTTNQFSIANERPDSLLPLLDTPA